MATQSWLCGDEVMPCGAMLQTVDGQISTWATSYVVCSCLSPRPGCVFALKPRNLSPSPKLGTQAKLMHVANII